MLALAALHDVADQASRGPVPPSLELRALLALLHGRSKGDRGCYDGFWRTVIAPDDNGCAAGQGYRRSTYARTEICKIARTLGVDPSTREYSDAIWTLCLRQRERVDPAFRAQRDVDRARYAAARAREAVYDREIIATKGHPWSQEGKRLMAARLLRGEEPVPSLPSTKRPPGET